MRVRWPDSSDICASETARLRMALELQTRGARLEKQMADSDLSLQVLVEMRDELRNVRDEARQTNRQLGELRNDVNERFAEVNERLDDVNERLEGTNQRLGIIEHTMVDYGTQLVMLGRYMKNSTSRNENDIADLRTRVEKLEAKD
jgi:predicted  nucleic acid-binding Zn-ribbon protein